MSVSRSLRGTRARPLAPAGAVLAAGGLLVSLTLSLQATARVSLPPSPVRYRPIGCVARGPQIAHRGGPPRREVALSFDDGPGPLTLSFVRMLHTEHAVATFFMIGRQISSTDSSLLKEELRDGDALGDHTWSHPDLVGSPEVASQLQSAKQAIARVSGYVPCVFRPPYGAYDNTVIRIARGLGLATVTWDVDPRDWALPGTGAIVARVLEGVRPGSIVISHDGGGPRGETLAAYPSIISALHKRGYRFVTVPQLLGFRTIYRACRGRCGEAAVKGPLPPGSIVEDGPTAHTAPRAGPTR